MDLIGVNCCCFQLFHSGVSSLVVAYGKIIFLITVVRVPVGNPEWNRAHRRERRRGRWRTSWRARSMTRWSPVAPIAPGVVSIGRRDECWIIAPGGRSQHNGIARWRSTVTRRIRCSMLLTRSRTSCWRSATIWWRCSSTLGVVCAGSLTW